MCSVRVESKQDGWPSDKVVLSVSDATCELFLFGAHVVSWKCQGLERLWMSTLSCNDGSKPIRGGIPIAFPQFADQGPLPLHGLARTAVWTLAAHPVASSSPNHDGALFAQARLALQDSPDTRALWPHRFRLHATVTLTPTSLTVGLEAHNTGEEGWEMTACLHTYLRTPDSSRLALSSLKGVEFVDKVDGMKRKREDNDQVVMAKVVEESGPNGCDRIYLNAPPHTTLRDVDNPARSLAISQTPGFADTVLYNPWTEGKRGDKGPDFDDDGYRCMFCVEAAVAGTPVTVPPGGRWEGMQTLRLGAHE